MFHLSFFTIIFQLTDPIVIPEESDDKMPFWRQRLIALYIDWAKTFPTFRNLPYADKVEYLFILFSKIFEFR